MKKFIIAGAIVIGVIITVIAYFAGDSKPEAATDTTAAETTAKAAEMETTAEETAKAGSTTGDNFNAMFADIYIKYDCVTIADSGNWIKVDSNPTDFPYYNDEEAIAAIDSINAALGFDLTDTMKNTTKEDGRQSASNDKYVVAWTYSEEKGLEATYAHRKG